MSSAKSTLSGPSNGCLEQLGLKENPFVEHAGDPYLYSDQTLGMTTNIILDYLKNAATAIVLTGESGVGKTTHLRKLLRRGYRTYQFCTIRANPEITFEEISKRITQRWRLREQSHDLSIENHIISYIEEHKHCALIVDDVDRLEPATLDELLRLKHRVGLASPDAGLGLVVAGRPELKLTLSELENTNPACAQMYQINVRPLTQSQVETYIQFRLSKAGLETNNLFDEKDIQRLFDQSGGNVGRIHALALNHIHQLCSPDRGHNFAEVEIMNDEVARPNNNALIRLIVIAAVIGALALLAWRFANKEEATPIVLDEIAIPAETETPNIAEREEASIPDATLEEIPVETAELAVEQPPLTSSEESADQPTAVDETDTPHTQAEQLAETTVEEATPEQSITTNEVPAKAEITEQAEEKTPEPKEQTDAIAQQEPPKTDTKPLDPQRSWLLDADPNHYTLQILAAQNLDTLKSFIKNMDINEQHAYFQKQVNGKTWNVLVVGNYATRQDALAAVDTLPKQLTANKPWPIPFSEPQKHLK